jgi:hypothetical protein
MSSPTIHDHLRDNLFVLAWVALAVIAKYSISFAPTGGENAAPAASNVAAAAAPASPTFDE